MAIDWEVPKTKDVVTDIPESRLDESIATLLESIAEHGADATWEQDGTDTPMRQLCRARAAQLRQRQRSRAEFAGDPSSIIVIRVEAGMGSRDQVYSNSRAITFAELRVTPDEIVDLTAKQLVSDLRDCLDRIYEAEAAENIKNLIGITK